MVAQVGECNASTLERVHQLINKTNQFNLTTRRHNMDDLVRLMESPDAAVAWLRLADRHGDSGLVCVGIITRLDEATWEIDTLLMSCRVMGRQIEDAFLAYLAELARSHGAQRLRGRFIPTPKNEPVLNFYSSRGFADLAEAGLYEASLAGNAFAWPAVIRRAMDQQQENVRA
jgi:FkbH-like protein